MTSRRPTPRRFTLALPPRIVERLHALVLRYNADQGTAFTLTEWLTNHVSELAVMDELQRTATDLAAQAQRDVDAAVAAERRRLIAGA